jgi:predicted DCC family thiol-disulfide oxidoreductase YuxK
MNDRETYTPYGVPSAESGALPQGAAVIGQVAAINASDSSHPVIFFDGVCGLCNRFVDFVVRRDSNAVFRFAPLQGQTAADRLAASDLADLKTVVVVEGDRSYRKSAAIVRVLRGLGGVWGVVAVLFWLVPRPLRDWGYSRVANNRYAIFGKKETCRLPSAEERSRFLP